MYRTTAKRRRMSALRCPALFGLVAFAVLVAAPGGASFAQQDDAARSIAAQNAALAARIADATAALGPAAAELAARRKSKDALDESMRRIEESAQVHTRGGELARTLVEQLRVLPKPGQFRATRDERRRMLKAASDAHLRTERQLEELGDLDAAVARRLAAAQPPVPEADRPRTEAAVRERLVAQRDLLTRLGEVQRKLMQALRETGDAERDLERRSQAARAELNRLLFRTPVPAGTYMLTELPQSLAWTVSPANWRAAGAVLRDEAARRPFWPALAVLVAVGLVAGRRRLQRGLVSLAPAAMTHERYRIGHALAALAITFALALPLPIAMWIAGTLLQSAPDTQAFARALGDALARVAPLPLLLSALAWFLDRRGVAVGHFGWDGESLGFAARALRRFAVFFVPLMFIVALNGLDYAPFANRESLARLALNVGMIAVAAFFVHLLRRRSPLMQRLRARAPRSWAVKLHAVWSGAVVALPIAIAALVGAGYFLAAGTFYARMVYSTFLVLGALILYGLIALWVHLQHASFLRRQAGEAARPAAGAAAGASASGIAEVPPPRLDIAAIGEQTRSLLDVLITLLVLGGMWWVWRDAAPFLSAIGDYRLWTYSETVDGKTVTHLLTVTGLFLAIVVGAVTAVAVRNVGALLDIVLLQRLEIQADATYAIKVIARYALTTAGVVVASSILGIGWSDVQWLVAALGVGLGFGLQEIFANLVSGLIMLAERPVRIGDVVTVGDVSGTVARIRARATTVIDFDNKEVLIPNKSFITDRVINWTLSDQITRLLLKIGVPRGTDIALAQRVMLDVVRGNPDVLKQPAPSVFFTGFGGSSLDFEIRAFVDRFDKRLRVQHEINFALDRALREHGIENPSGLAVLAGAESHD
jgi:potassium efflux system protein